MPTPRAFAGWRSLSRSGPTSDVPCRSIGTLTSIPCSTRELSSCLRTFVLDVAHFRLRPAPLIVCVVIHLREPERGFRNPYLGDLAPFARNVCRRVALPSLCSLGPLVAENRFHDFDGFPARFLQWNGFRCTAATPHTSFAYPLATLRLHPAAASTAEEFRMVRPPELHELHDPIWSFDQSGAIDS
jgi:hypothetical protein